MSTKLHLLFTITIVFLSFYGKAQTNYWQNVELKGKAKAFSKNSLKVDKGKAFKLDEIQFKEALKGEGSHVVYFPNEYGIQEAYLVSETPLFAKALAKKYPDIRSYQGMALKNQKRQIRFSVSHKGIQSMVEEVGENGALFMQKSKKDIYISYRRTQQTDKNLDFICTTTAKVESYSQQLTSKLVDDQQLRIFRVAISASGEYTQFHGGTKADALAAINASLTRINGVFERDLAVRLELIANTDEVIYLDPETDPYSGNLSSQAQNTFTTVIGEANYDIGHLFNQAENTLDGNAGFIGSVCRDNLKGSGYTTLSTPVGDIFDIDLVAHEIGHQFGANHSFSHISEGTLVQVEPASGNTIMGYAGITQANDVAANSDDYFHYVSIKQIRDYLATVSCGQVLSLTNATPTLTTLSDYVIPTGTAFVLTGEAADVDGNVLTYNWEQIDNGIVTQATFGPNNPAGANFKSLPASISPQRYFPKLERVLSGQLTEVAPVEGGDWETVSNIGRQLNYSLTVRDNAVGGGQLISDELSVTVINDAGPFLVTSQADAVSYIAGTVQTIDWDVANTEMAPISASTVDILLSSDGGLTYPTVLIENTPNDGSQEIIIPSIDTSNGRIMVKPVNNVFFAVNQEAISITPTEIILDFEQVVFDVCKPNDLSVDFNYETYLGFNEESTFSIASTPPGLNVQFTPLTATDTNTPVSIDFTGIDNLEEGVYPIQVLATAASITKNITLQVRVFDSDFEIVNLVAPVNGLQDTSADVLLEWDENTANTSYDVEIATDEAFNAIVETASVFVNSYAPSLLENNTEYFWRVRPKNDCGEGVFSAVFNFTTIEFNCDTSGAVELPLTISSSGTPVVTTQIIFLEDLPVSDVNVNIDLEHTFLEDLVINLISPSGTTVALVSSSCGEFDDINATFDDDAIPFSCGNGPAISGTVRPLGSLSSFIGESILGTWTLEIRDNASADGGRLNAFSLEICVEGDFRPDEDNDGVFDDGDDLCLGTPEGQTVDVNGCPISRFPSQNFTIGLESESCIGNDDGQILITPKIIMEYQVNVVGNGLNIDQEFTNSFNLSNLSSGTYTLCISGSDGLVNYDTYCVEVEITQPEPLEVTTKLALDGSQITLELQGSNLYNVELNGVVTQTTASNLVLDLPKGLNSLKVFTNLVCQGVYEEQLGNYEIPLLVPNPVINIAEVYFGFGQQEVQVEIFNASGKLVNNLILNPSGEKLTIDFSQLSSGIYYVRFFNKGLKGTSKVIKK